MDSSLVGLATVTGGAGNDTLTVDGSQQGATSYNATSTTLDTIAVGGFEYLSLTTGSSADRIYIQGTAPERR